MGIIEVQDTCDHDCISRASLAVILTSIRTMMEYNPAQAKQKLTMLIKECLYQ